MDIFACPDKSDMTKSKWSFSCTEIPQIGIPYHQIFMINVLNSNIDFELSTAVINIKPIWAASAKNAGIKHFCQSFMGLKPDEKDHLRTEICFSDLTWLCLPAMCIVHFGIEIFSKIPFCVWVMTTHKEWKGEV